MDDKNIFRIYSSAVTKARLRNGRIEHIFSLVNVTQVQLATTPSPAPARPTTAPRAPANLPRPLLSPGPKQVCVSGQRLATGVYEGSANEA